MARYVLAEGTPADLANQEFFRSLDESLDEGDRVEWFFHLRMAPPTDAIQGLYDNLMSQGVLLWGGGVFGNGNTLVVRSEKGIAPLTIIALAIAAAIALIAIMIAWTLYQAVGVGGAGWLVPVGIGALLLMGMIVGGRQEEVVIRR